MLDLRHEPAVAAEEQGNPGHVADWWVKPEKKGMIDKHRDQEAPKLIEGSSAVESINETTRA